MMKLKTAGRFLSVATLAASTALTGPLAALAQEPSPPTTQEELVPPAVEPAPPAETAPSEAPVEPPTDIAPEPAPEPASPEIAPDEAPEPAAPAPAQPGGASTPPVQAAPDSGPPVGAPVGNPAELPADAGTENDANGSETSQEAPAVETERAPQPTESQPGSETSTPSSRAQPPAVEAPVAPAEPTASPSPAPSPVPPSAPQPGTEPSTPAVDPATRAAPETPPTAPSNAEAPNAAPVLPGTPPAPSQSSDPAGSASGTAPTSPSAVEPPPSSPEAAPAQPQAAAPVPVAPPEPVAAEIQTAPVPQGGVGQSDARVQQLSQPVEIRPVRETQGQPIQAPPAPTLPPQVQVERVGDRDILSLVAAGVAGAAVGGAAAYFIRPNDDARLSRGSDEVRFEQLPRGLTRQTIRRSDGVEIVSIENEYGDVVQRSRITPDGRETVLFYDPYAEDDDRPDYYRDAGADLPPIRVTIPEDRYIVDIAEPDEELYYDTIVAPPVETVERIYSVDEVRRSNRIREKVRRIDLNTINFAFGSADIEQGQVENLQALADAVKRVIDENPGEVFLLEGHTDAVGSNVANLALSDRRAESVASALTQYFDIPAENMVTQGYGEEDLKVDTQEASRENRRVTLRRITSLVKPVNTAAAN